MDSPMNILFKDMNVDNDMDDHDIETPKYGSQGINKLDESCVNDSYLLFDGTTKRLNDLIVGDVLMGSDSKPSTVTDIIKTTTEIYKVLPNKGLSFIVAETEILPMVYSGNTALYWKEDLQIYEVWYFDVELKRKTRKTFSVKVYEEKEKAFTAATDFKEKLDISHYFETTLKEYFQNADTFHYKLYKKGLDFPHKEFEIDPYIIGLWLGDGCHSGPIITSGDIEIVDYLRDYFEDFGMIIHTNGIDHRVRCKTRGYPGKNIFLNYLREKKLLNDKHIPLEFLLTSKTNRLRLLAGLLDSDGHLNGNRYEFVQKRENLFDQFIFLCRSLGFSCYKAPCISICMNAPNGPKPGKYFRCSVAGEGLEEIPSLLHRKTAQKHEFARRANVTGFSITSLGEREINKIVTDNPTFLMSDFTIRHRHESELKEVNNFVKKKGGSVLVFGYKYVPDGIALNIEEAKIVEFIFEEKYNNITLTKIAEKLNAKNLRTRKNLKFTVSIISGILAHKDFYLGYDNYPKILKEEKYKEDVGKNKNGRVHYGYTKDCQINEKEAEVIRFIFKENNTSTHLGLAEKLNAAGYKHPNCDTWKKHHIPTILKNKSKYLGQGKYPAILKI